MTRGFVLLPVVVAITLLATVAFLINYESVVESRKISGRMEAAQAQYAAQAGLAHANWFVQRSGCAGDATMTSVPLGAHSYNATVTAGGGSNTAYDLSVDQDAWIRSDSVDQNNGGNADQHIRFESGNTEQALFRFDLSSLPAGSQINSAAAWFYVKDGQGHPEGSLTVHKVTADWSEAGATWASLNGSFENQVLDSIPAQASGDVWVRINLTAQVQAWVNGEPNYGIMLGSTAEGVHTTYVSREGPSNQHPRLEVVVGNAPASPASIQATGTLANGVTRTLTRTAVKAYQPSSTLSLQPSTEGTDAEIWDQAPDNNYGDAAETWVSSASNDTTRSLLRFNMDAIPAGARILGATLSLLRQSGSGADQPVSAHRIMNPWSEDSVTWNRRESGTNWDTAGGDFDNTAVATTPVGPANQRYEWNITPLAQGWVDGSYPNYGVVLTAAIPGMDGHRFFTSEHGTASNRPKLTVTYACECGSACLAPQGSGTVLMVVVNPTTLVPDDAYKKTLFESWGYTVDILSESANQASYDAAVGTSDVVFISDTVNASQVGSKLVDAPKGVVSQDGTYNGDLGIASSSAWPVGSAINVTDNSHFITLPFPSGSLDIYSAAMEGLAVSGTEAPGLQTLADWGSAGALVVLDQGAALDGGGNAAGRRVMLPLGRENKLNWSYLNSNGLLMVQRALAWGAGNEVATSGPNVLLVVGDAANPSSQENAKKALMESWGYTVNLIDDNDTQANFDAAVAANDAAYVAQEVRPNDLGTKLVSATIGIVNEDTDLYDEFGVAERSWTANSQTAISIVDNTHHITSPFTTGDLTFLTASQTIAVIDDSSAIAPDLQALAETTGGTIKVALSALDAGATTWDGGSAAGRRVQLPWAPDTFDINGLNTDGQTLMQRAIEWAMGSGCGSMSPLLLLVVSDDSNPTSQETARQTLMTSWCYKVTLIDDDAASGEFAAAMALNDVIYVSQEITTLTVVAKLKDATIGIVNEEYLIGDDFGFASGTGSGFYNDMNLVDNTHYITSGFSLGALALFSPSYDIYTGAGFTLAPDLQVLGEAGSMSVLVALDAGGALWDSGTAAGRRVQVPWGDDFSALNTDGKTLMRQAIEWAAGGGGVMGPIAHWKLDDGSGGTAIDSEGGHNGTLVGDLNWVSGQLGGGLMFDGLDDRVTVPHDTTLSLTNAFTLSANINNFSLSGYDLVLNKGTSGTNQNYWFGTHNDEITFGFYTDGYREFTTSGVNLQTSTWYHIAATFDNASDQVRLYLNGSEVLSTSTTYVPTTNAEDLQIGRSQHGEYWTGKLDEIRIYDRALDSTEVGELAVASGGSVNQYVEAYESWNAGQADTWEVMNLGGAPFNVPPDAVLEIAISNSTANREYWGGVRAVGSGLERRFRLHEAEMGGVDAVVMHVQADGSSRIEHYVEHVTNVTFTLLGYWTQGTYVERFDTFKAGANGSWQNHNLSAYGVDSEQVAEIVIANTSATSEYQAGARPVGADMARTLDIHEAEAGGVDTATMLVTADNTTNAGVDLWAESDANIDFTLVGFWNTPPGVYTETAGVEHQPSVAGSWQDWNLGSQGVPAEAVVHIAMANLADGAEVQMGLHQKGSTLERRLDLQEAEAGGADLAGLHVNADAASTIQWYSETASTDQLFYLLGWWVLGP